MSRNSPLRACCHTDCRRQDVDREADITQVAALWRGQVPLAKTAWFYGLVGLLLLIVPFTLISSLGLGPSMHELLLALSVATLLYAAFIAVAIWRAAGNYQGRLAWRLLAKGSVVFVVLQVVASLAAG
jgi:hypothetical protein